MGLKNFTEEVALEVLNEIKGMHPNCCFCEKCTQDILAIALTRLKGKYAVTREGEIFARVEQSDRQVRADALLAVMEGIDKVSKRPKHDPGKIKLD